MGDITGINASDVLGLGKGIEKLIDAVSKGLGTFYQPIHKVRMAKASAKEIRYLSEAINENLNLPMLYNNGDLSIDSQSAEELIQRTGNRFLFQELKKQQNIEAVVAVAYTELENEENISSTSIDQDWIIRFFNSVEDVSNEEMQRIWGKVLSGEIKRPTTFSLRTLTQLKNMNQKDAELFSRIISFAFITDGRLCLPGATELLMEYDINIKDILDLEEAGLIYSNLLSCSYKISIKDNETLTNRNLVCLLSSESEVAVEFQTQLFSFTKAGSELFFITESDSNNDIFLKYLKIAKAKAMNCSFKLYNFKDFDGSNITYDDKLVLEI